VAACSSTSMVAASGTPKTLLIRRRCSIATPTATHSSIPTMPITSSRSMPPLVLQRLATGLGEHRLREAAGRHTQHGCAQRGHDRARRFQHRARIFSFHVQRHLIDADTVVTAGIACKTRRKMQTAAQSSSATRSIVRTASGRITTSRKCAK
jgi:hypothetical protein